MTTCKANNPATCRYHGAYSAETLRVHRTVLQNMYVNVLETYQKVSRIKPELSSQYLNAFQEVARLKDETDVYYYGTDEGIEELEALKAETEDLNEILRLETLQKLATEKRNLIEKNPNIQPVNVPSHEKIFTFPVVNQKTNKLAQVVEATGNKYSPFNTIPRVRDMVKTDLKKAIKLGFLPEDVNFKVQSSPKSNVITLFASTTDKETLRKAKAIATAYNKATFNTTTGEPEQSHYVVSIKVPKE